MGRTVSQRRRQTLNLEPETDRKDTRETEKQPERVCVPLRTRLSLCVPAGRCTDFTFSQRFMTKKTTRRFVLNA